MSVHVSSAVWGKRPGEGSRARGVAFTVLLSLADQANDEGYSHPGVRNIARRSRCSERSAQNHIRYLMKLGELEVEERVGHSNEYRVLWGWEGADDETRAAARQRAIEQAFDPQQQGGADPAPPQEAPEGVQTAAPTPADSCTRGVQTAAPRNVIEPSLNRQGGRAREAQPAAAAPTPLKSPSKDTRRRLDRCTRHQDDTDSPSCGACADARRSMDLVLRERLRAASQERSRAAHEAARLRLEAVRRCAMCDDLGYRGRAVCDHEARDTSKASEVRKLVRPTKGAGKPLADSA